VTARLDLVRVAIAVVVATLLMSTGADAQTRSSKGTGQSGQSAPAKNDAASPYAERFGSLCAACHGANGRSEMAGTPVLAGQHSFYAITQLFMFREGRRANEAMTAVAKGMKDDDMRGFAAFIATLPPVPAPAPDSAPDPDRIKRGQQLAQQHRCVFCHGADFSGGQQVPRIGDQREDYLRLTLQEFKAGKRPGYTMAMIEAVGPVSVEELDTLAYYIARFSSVSGKPGK
jgi:cytochrome c553